MADLPGRTHFRKTLSRREGTGMKRCTNAMEFLSPSIQWLVAEKCGSILFESQLSEWNGVLSVNHDNTMEFCGRDIPTTLGRIGVGEASGEAGEGTLYPGMKRAICRFA